jgi:hypothetical protein
MTGFQPLLLKEILRLWKGQESGRSRAPRVLRDASPASAADLSSTLSEGER